MRIQRGQNQTTLRHARKTITFSNDSGTVTVFTITGRVMVGLTAQFVTANLIETGSVTGIELGVSSDANLLVLSTNPEDLDANEWWVDATPGSGGLAAAALQKDVLISEDIILTITGGTDIASGAIIFDVWYLPVTDNGALA